MHQEIKVALHTCWPEASSERPPKSPIKLGLFVWFQSPQFPIVKSAQDTYPRNVEILLLLLRALTVVFLHGGLGRVVVVLESLTSVFRNSIASFFSASLRSVYCS